MPRSANRNLFQRFWVMNPTTVNNYGSVITNPNQVICLPIPKEVLTKTAVSFLQFNQSSPEGKHWMLMTQALLYATYKMGGIAAEMEAKDKKLTIEKFAQVRLETVYSDDEEDAKVLQYRLWIFVENPVLNIGDGLEAMLKENGAIFERYDGSYSVSASKDKRPSFFLPGQKDWKSNLYPHEQYRLIKNKAMWARNLCDLYIGRTRCASQMEKVESLQHTLKDPNNPANPANVFNVPDAFLFHTPRNAHPAQADINRYRVMDEYNGQIVYKFPAILYNHHVLKIPFNDCMPGTFCHRWLPEYQHNKLQKLQDELLNEFPSLRSTWERYDQNATTDVGNPNLQAPFTLDGPEQQLRNTILQSDLINNQPVEDERPFEPHILLESHMDTAMDLLNSRVFQYYYTSDFKLLREENQRTLDSLKKETDPSVYKESYEKFEKEAFENFEGRCWSPDSDISEIGHLIRAWSLRKEVKEYKIKHIKFDPNLSVFGNMVARKMECYDDYLFISGTHRNFFIFNHAKYDAYRHSNDLHFNVFATGVGGTSKSYLFKLLEDLSIEGTVEQLSYETLRANAIDRDNNDTITLMNEIPEDMTEKGVGGSTMQSSFKERLTSLKVKVKLFQKDENTGYRDQRTSVSECIGVWFGATNDDFSKMDEALLTRFYQAYFTESQREERDIASLMYASKSMTDKEKNKVKEFIMEQKIEQLRYFLVEKLIMTHCLPDFNPSTAQIFFRKFLDKLRKDGYHCHSRTIERMMIMTRILCICNALECLFNVPTAKYYDQVFEISQLKDIKPYLQASWEILHFVCGLFADQLVNPAEDDIMAAIKMLHESNKDQRRFREFSAASDEVLAVVSNSQQNNQSTPFTRGQNSDIQLNDSNVRQTSGVSVLASTKKKVDYNYVFFKMTMTQMAAEIYRVMENNASRPSPNHIKNFITMLKGRTVRSRNYDKKDTKIKEPELDPTSEETSGPALVTDSEGLYFHYSGLAKDHTNQDRIGGYLKQMWYSKTLPQRIIYGVCVEGQPQLFKTLDVEPNPNKELIVYNILHVNRCARIMLYNNDPEALGDETRRGDEMDIIDVDLDTKSLMQQLDILELPWDEVSLRTYHPFYISARENKELIRINGIDEEYREKTGRVRIKNTFTYYQDFIAKHEERKADYTKALETKGSDFEQKFGKYFSSHRKRTRESKEVPQSAEFFTKIDFAKRVKKDNYEFYILEDDPTPIGVGVVPVAADVQAPVQVRSLEPVTLPLATETTVSMDEAPVEQEDYWANRAQQTTIPTTVIPQVIAPKPSLSNTPNQALDDMFDV